MWIARKFILRCTGPNASVPKPATECVVALVFAALLLIGSLGTGIVGRVVQDPSFKYGFIAEHSDKQGNQ